MSIRDKKRKEMRQRIFTSVSIVILFSVAQPFLWGYVLSSAQNLNRVRTSDAQYILLEERLSEIQESSVAQQQLFDQLSVSFPFSDSKPRLVARLEQVGDQYGANVDIQQIGDVEVGVEKSRDESIEEFVVTVRVIGSPDSLFSYLDAVEHLQELTTVESWSIGRVTSGESLEEFGVVPQFELLVRIIFYLQVADG